ncbi:hypothetical protein [Anaerotignum sp. MB30-C6]|uniref:hypothetical protein n=1 Tax=Anaerotignum sp. MB30-C6 TaxID=3070814 RepID=UPI0027DD5F13|nr:hypothetical protein [Anaerotignum sp. MB30-C6]WMI81806.1 hypothetical protein RBQ60_03505 [Anaerotignum sp. MB30-C6]
MTNYETNPVYRAILRRNDKRRIKRDAEQQSRQKRAKVVQAIKITLLRVINVITILAFVVVMECILFNRLVLKWTLIFIFVVVFTDLIESKVKQSKSPQGTAIPVGDKHK